MARREAFVTIDAEGRDKGKVFRITEQPAEIGEEWAAQVFAGMMAAGVDIPDEIVQGGIAGLVTLFVRDPSVVENAESQARGAAMLTFGLRSLAKMPWAVSGPLYRALMSCVVLQTDPVNNPSYTRVLVSNDIEEVSTRLKLRMEVLKLHVDFSSAAAP